VKVQTAYDFHEAVEVVLHVTRLGDLYEPRNGFRALLRVLFLQYPRGDPVSDLVASERGNTRAERMN
jgi:hypothetical protein